MLLSQGKTHYFGPVGAVADHYERLGHRVPVHVNPAEFLLELTNIDFASDRASAARRLDEMALAWAASPRAKGLAAAVAKVEREAAGDHVQPEPAEEKPGLLSVVLTLLHRSFVKSYRDVVVYGVRLAMYTGEEAILMLGTKLANG